MRTTLGAEIAARQRALTHRQRVVSSRVNRLHAELGILASQLENLTAELADLVNAAGMAAYAVEHAPAPCAHDDLRERKYLGVYASTAGPQRLHVDQCLMCDDLVVVAELTPNGGARAVSERATINFPSQLAG